ncbi:hypothetical protein FE257_003957 [Aspergillus nanangensis]|uniref:RNase H type-1 domain-containing protein n=1 Tax=Aspergillus nanangensis TaxID=2582783 RepID=A0AAD4GWA6_ASPNN|nr:hypothetical protein FE257_003957 [Aspergillus nanangensis]
MSSKAPHYFHPITIPHHQPKAARAPPATPTPQIPSRKRSYPKSQPQRNRSNRKKQKQKSRGGKKTKDSSKKKKGSTNLTSPNPDGHLNYTPNGFPGQLFVKQRGAALEDAQTIYSIPTPAEGRQQHHVFWCDGATDHDGRCGASVVHKKVHNGDDADANWVFHGYAVKDLRKINPTELFALGEACRSAIQALLDWPSQEGMATEASSDVSTETDEKKVMAVVARRVVGVARRLQDAGVEVRVNWCPGHEHVPGQERADKVAVASRRLMKYSKGHMKCSQDGTVLMVDSSCLDD